MPIPQTPTENQSSLAPVRLRRSALGKAICSVILLTAVLSASPLMAVNNYTGIVDPDGSIHVGSDSLFTVLTANNFNNLNDQFTGPSLIQGNVGIGGRGNYSMSDGTVDGDFY